MSIISGGHKIPAGVNVSISPSIFHCNPEVFPDPETFDPDRFLPENMDKRNAYDYIPFSAGLRNCVGQKFAQLNEKVLLIHMLKNYRIEPMLGFLGTRPTMEVG